MGDIGRLNRFVALELIHAMNSMKRIYGLGRLKQGEMNRTEKAYSDYLLMLKNKGLIQDFWFECVKFKVASNRCEYLPDFLVLRNNGALELHEVKGSKIVFQDDAKVKCKVCADKYPFPLYIVFPRPKKHGGGWIYEEM